MANPKYAPLAQREAQKRTVDEIDRILNPSGQFVRPNKQINYEQLRQRQKQEKALLEEMTPKDVTTDEQKKFVVGRLAKLEEAMRDGNPVKGIPPMPTKQKMWEADAGAVGEHRIWEETWKKHTLDEEGNLIRVQPGERGAISQWKDLRRCLFKDREEYDPDISNVEMFRPDERLSGSRKQVYASPFSGKSYSQYEAIMGTTGAVTDVQQKVREAEESGQVAVPSVERIYKTDDAPVIRRNLEYICGAEAANGQICRMPVKGPGIKCRHHKEKKDGS